MRSRRRPTFRPTRAIISRDLRPMTRPMIRSAAGLALMLAMASPLQAQAQAEHNLADLAARTCPSAFADLAEADRAYWGNLTSPDVEAPLTQAQHDSALRFAAAAVATAASMGDFLLLQADPSQAVASFDVIRARHTLSDCLFPTPETRASFLAFATEIETVPPDAAERHFFGGFDQYVCTGVQTAMREITALDTDEPDIATRISTIIEATLRTCPEHVTD